MQQKNGRLNLILAIEKSRAMKRKWGLRLKKEGNWNLNQDYTDLNLNFGRSLKLESRVKQLCIRDREESDLRCCWKDAERGNIIRFDALTISQFFGFSV